LNVRLANPKTDIAAIADVVSNFELQHIPHAVVRGWFEHNPDGRITHRSVAEDDSGAVVGYGLCVHETWSPTGSFYAWVGVLPDAAGRGLGSALYEDAAAFLTAQNATNVSTDVRDNDPRSRAFAEHRGYIVTRHQFMSLLDLAVFDASAFPDPNLTLGNAGLTVFSMADCHDSPQARRLLFEINRETCRDIPGFNGEHPNFEEFEQVALSGPRYYPAGQIIVADGDEWVGFAAVTLNPDDHSAYNLMTGVRRAYRGRGIATALKLLAIEFARKNGAKVITTDNDSENAPMLAVNRKLGYQPQPGRWILRKELQPVTD